MDGFPYAPRPGQRELIQAMSDNAESRGHLIVEAGTGTGKTACALAGLSGRRVVYATRTNTQQDQVIKEQRMRDDGRLVIPFMGRRHHCPLLKEDQRFQGGTPEELGRLCRDAKRKAVQAHATGKLVTGACPFYQRLLEDGTGPVEALVQQAPDAGALGARIAAAGSCPYEALKLLLPEAHAVVVPYIYLVDDQLRNTLMEWMGTTADAVHLVVDEAHNLPEVTRQHHSPRLGLPTIERALREAHELGDPLVGNRILAASFLGSLHATVRELVGEHAGEAADGRMPAHSLWHALLAKTGAPSTVLHRIIQDLQAFGEAIREQRRRDGKLPRSHLGAVGAFLALWELAQEGPYVHLALREPRPALEAYLLDPASRLAWLQEFASTVQMSGTLAPLASHVLLTGLPPSTRQISQPSPFDPARLRVRGIIGARRPLRTPDEDPTITATHQQEARRILRTWSGRIAIWFPSHAMLADYLEEGFLHDIDASIHAESPDMDTPSLLRLVERFRQDPRERVILCGVLGGRLTEGIDYPGDALEKALILAVPYPAPSARNEALIHHYDDEPGRGWRIAVHEPTGRTLRQAVGRLIRGPEDHGHAVILDERAMRFRDCLPMLQMVKPGDEDAPPSPEGFASAATWAKAAANA